MEATKEQKAAYISVCSVLKQHCCTVTDRNWYVFTHIDLKPFGLVVPCEENAPAYKYYIYWSRSASVDHAADRSFEDWIILNGFLQGAKSAADIKTALQSFLAVEAVLEKT